MSGIINGGAGALVTRGALLPRELCKRRARGASETACFDRTMRLYSLKRHSEEFGA